MLYRYQLTVRESYTKLYVLRLLLSFIIAASYAALKGIVVFTNAYLLEGTNGEQVQQ